MTSHSSHEPFVGVGLEVTSRAGAELRAWPRATVLAVLGVVGLAVLVRLSNAFAYPIGMGFDAIPNWEYIAGLADSWELPHPEDGFTTAHPPLFYYAAAFLRLVLGSPGQYGSTVAIRFATAVSGLVAVAGALLLVARSGSPGGHRPWLTAALIAFLPAHVYASAMLNEEVAAAGLVSVALVALCWQLESPARRSLAGAALVGGVAGLALLTKLSGAIVLGVVCGCYALCGLRRKDAVRGVAQAGVAALAGLCLGGWFYARNLVEYGYLYPYALPMHRVMMTWPPGERALWDYLYVPVATFLDPRVVQPDLLRSVWGGTYITLWYDGHMHYLPRYAAAAKHMGQGILVAGLLPTVAFVVGWLRGVRRALAGSATDTALVGLVIGTLAGYVLFTWRNPWFPTVKATYLLGLAVPFGVYAGEVLDAWARGRARLLVWIVLAGLGLAIVLTFTYGLVFEKPERPGFG